ncbi:MIP/aquaporin family protein [Solitalea canadensis]|uniref:Permease, glycerol uptake facilitator n=1 Tax=Solitalea canadensis (strain ATCC 29591 / DSM 3403 / JCM 21819 / LMG 8368 / NBRC 15130 / NCIMB 12057 / USAM 9D) TaxID=929556 RepID=H8KWN6_SOLCM|nr:MIP/aquaporin family protein [Solitalea canadensis]AFD08215.1 permease, glycerol uptake facilitator [Solitalea canadensis DSM 3403]
MSNFISEFIGTAVLILLGGGVVANVVLNKTKGNSSGWIVITAGWAFAVFCGVIVSMPSGAHLNPAVSLCLAIAGKFSWASMATYITAQLFGAMTGAFLVWLTYKDHFDQSDAGSQLAVFSTGPAIKNPILNLISEVIGTFVLTFVILWFGTGANVQGLAALGPLPVSILVWAIGLSLGGTTGYAINPARDLGPRIMHAILPMKNKGSSDWQYALIPVAGPLIGGALAAIIFNCVQ